jgi:hypothetical protein
MDTTQLVDKILSTPGELKSLKKLLAVALSNDPARASLIADAAANFKVYSALLSQTGTAAPTAKVLDNTLSGTPVLARTGAGVYTLVLSGGDFTADKTFIITGVSTTAGATFSAVRTNTTTITITTSNASNAAADVLLTDTPIEVRVYN